MKKFLGVYILIIFSFPLPLMAQPITIGTTFSPTQCTYLDLEWKETYLAILDLPLDMIRLAAYWSEIEDTEGQYDFTNLDWMIQEAKKRKIPVVLVVGMKAPRWPEYFLPGWVIQKINLRFGQVVTKHEYLREKTRTFVEQVVKHYRDEDIIRYWQVENEALNRFGGRHWRMGKDFLAREVDWVKELDPHARPVVLTASTYPNNFLRIISKIFTNVKPIRENLKLADIMGINVYPVVGQRLFGRNHYYGSRSNARITYFKEIFDQAAENNKDIWVTELQAEPWEPGKLTYTKTTHPPSSRPDQTERAFQELRSLGYKTFFLWGAEYWYYQKKEHDNTEWWNFIEDLIDDYSKDKTVPST